MGRNFTPEQRAQQARQRAAEKSAEQRRAQTHKARLANAERRTDRAIAKRYPHAKGCLTLDMQGGNHCECGATDARRRHKEETMSEGTERYFPVLRHDRYASYGCPDKVPWELVAAHEPQAYQNHGQTVQRLADRGGLDPTELVAVLQDRRWRPMGPAAASEHLLALVKRHEEVLKPVLGQCCPLDTDRDGDCPVHPALVQTVQRAGTGPGLYQVQRPKEYSHEQRATLWQTVARCTTYELALRLVDQEAQKGPGYARIFCDPGEVAAAFKLPR